MCSCSSLPHSEATEHNALAFKAHAVAERAYIALLRTGPYYRVKMQEELCLLRDFIAELNAVDPQEAQAFYEAKALAK